MRVGFLLGVAFVASCQDPIRTASFKVSPQAVPSTDSAVLTQSREIAGTVAEKYHLHLLPPYERCPLGRYFAPDSLDGREIGLNLCVRPENGVTVFDLWEGFTSHWGRKGTALHGELLAILRSRFGAVAVTEK